jgi:hypothetical protein
MPSHTQLTIAFCRVLLCTSSQNSLMAECCCCCCCRSAEAASWGGAAQKLWANAGQGFAGVELPQVLGDESSLKGQGQHGRGALVSLLTRRLLPVFV